MTTSLSIDAATTTADAALFSGFRPFRQMTNGVEIARVIGSNGLPLLLLHDHPQGYMIWHKVAYELVHDCTVVVADLCGYGALSKPTDSARHDEYSERTMAQDQVEVIRALGFGRFRLCVRDRKARVAYWLYVDHPFRVERAMLFDTAPTLVMHEHTDMASTSAYWHWPFLVQPPLFPKTLINVAPDFYIGKLMGLRHAGLEPFAPGAMATYTAVMHEPACAHVVYKGYRAAATVDLEHDRADRDAGKRANVPLRVLWGEHGVIQHCFKPLELWRAMADNVSDGMTPCGHYVPEEAPEALLEEMRTYFT